MDEFKIIIVRRPVTARDAEVQDILHRHATDGWQLGEVVGGESAELVAGFDGATVIKLRRPMCLDDGLAPADEPIG